MAARALWKGSISFGLVNIPVALFKAVRDVRPRFRMLHAHDRSPVRFERVCIRDGRALAWEDLVKGYEYERGRFVVLTEDDFKAAAIEKTRTIDIVDFVNAGQVDDRFFETPYYVVPAQGAERAWGLLREAIRGSGRIGIAKFILREAQHLCAVEAIGEAMVLSVMRFADELVDASPFERPAVEGLRPREVEMAKALVDSLTAEWNPGKYTDRYRENLMKIIKAKARGRRATLTPDAEPRQAEVVDLMERLRRSLAQGGHSRRPPKRRPAKTHGRKRRHAA
ncbi:MAG: Ku protein [Acidobacteria bacterium]|nr:Ku protein [Acidobacteriota bacterium]